MKNVWIFTIGLLAVLVLMVELVSPEKQDNKSKIFFKRNTDKIDYKINPLYDLGN